MTTSLSIVCFMSCPYSSFLQKSHNPFTATEVCMHTPAKQYIFWPYNKSAFNVVCFDQNQFICQCKKESKKVSLMVSNFAHLLVVLE